MMHARIGVLRALNRDVERVFDPAQRYSLGTAEAEEGSMNVKGSPLLCRQGNACVVSSAERDF